jgi:proline dehydrogenase
MFKYIAGNTIKHSINTSKKVLTSGKIPIINYAIEETKDIDRIYNEHINLISSIGKDNKIAIKLSSFNFDNLLINKLIDKAKKKNIQIVIDAEKGDDFFKYQHISNELVFDNNKDKCNVVKTYQMYRKDSLQLLKEDINFFKSKNIISGNKIVRGAYWNSENKEGYLFNNKNDTDISYNSGSLFLSENSNYSYNILATHNKESINLGILLNKIHNKKVFDFAHLLGMREDVYNNLKSENVHVYIPYGPYKDMIPYLFRRLYENIDTLKYMF